MAIRRSPFAIRYSHKAFSLAELMIALVILGLGLLFIAAALPVGIDYTRQTVDLATAEAAGEYAVEQVEGRLRVSSDLLYEGLKTINPPINRRMESIHRPRWGNAPPISMAKHSVDVNYEPFIKVRPLVTGNVRMGANQSGWVREIVDDAETTIRAYLAATGSYPIPVQYQAHTQEVDYPMGLLQVASLADNPLLPGLARAYPPIEPVTGFTVNEFFGDTAKYPTYGPRFSRMTEEQVNAECSKAIDRRLAWTAFYRRISYAGRKGPDNTWFTDDDIAEAPLLYEIIIVVTRRVSANHRFPRQNVSAATNWNTYERPSAYAPGFSGDEQAVGADRMAPMPWLAIFDSGATNPPALPLLTVNTDYVPIVQGAGLSDKRVIHPDFTDLPTLTFRCSAELGALLPVGSIFIPAVNDQRRIPRTEEPTARFQSVGFVPSAPEAMPIYEVTERPDDTTVIVKNNGHYPWVVSGNASDTRAFPCWVIPPCFTERAGGQPVYERTSPIVRVIRRTINLKEITP